MVEVRHRSRRRPPLFGYAQAGVSPDTEADPFATIVETRSDGRGSILW